MPLLNEAIFGLSCANSQETELARSIDSQGEFTLFAPTDLAFNEFLQKLGGVKEGVGKLKKNPQELGRLANWFFQSF